MFLQRAIHAPSEIAEKGRDTAARYGGEEFVVILRQTTLEGATKLADQIRTNVENKKLVKKSTGDILGTITISIGVAQLHAEDTPERLIQRADRALYRAKNNGRNHVTTEATKRHHRRRMCTSTTSIWWWCRDVTR